MKLFGKEIKLNMNDKLNGFGDKLTGGINKHLGNIKIPTVQTNNKIELSKEIYIAGGALILIVIFLKPIKRFLGFKK